VPGTTMSVLITGGAGYIGSHAVLAFREAGYPVVVIDDLSTGHRGSVPPDVPFVLGSAGDSGLVSATLERYGIGAVVHFAGSCVVPESVHDPLKYYENNTCVSRALIGACARQGVRGLLFSSTAAVYGIPRSVPVSEDAETRPINPYGASKLAVEWILRDVSRSCEFRYAALRYFNVAGADPAGRIGQSTRAATHLIKIASQAAAGVRASVTIHGADYATADGTCVRDYIHVADLASAHVRVLARLLDGGPCTTLNCGYGRGYSVREVIDKVREVSGRDFEVAVGPRRAGDPDVLVADGSRIRQETGWQPRFDDLEVIVRTALAWERRLASGS